MSAFAGIIDGFRTRSGEMTFLDRLDDFRGRLIISLIALTLATGVGFWVSAWPLSFDVPVMAIQAGRFGSFQIGGWHIDIDVLRFIVDPIEPYLNGEKLKYLSPTDPFFITLKMAIAIGIALALPIILYQLWGLFAPLMNRSERRLAAPALVASVVLFGAGALFCYFMVIPLMLRFTLGFQAGSLEQAIVIGEYLKIVLRMLLAFGLAFELPIIVLIGTLLGIVTPTFLAEKRRHALAILTVVSAIITPPDISSQVLLMIPVWGLYEASIILSRIIVARRRGTAVAVREA